MRLRCFGKRDPLYEYGESGRCVFRPDGSGGDAYEADGSGSQAYPKRGQPFARDGSGRQFYARDRDGDEYYPARDGMSMLIVRDGGRPAPAKRVSGRERYPTDSDGCEFYPTDPASGRPLVLLDGGGREYFASDGRGHDLIPWNRMGRRRRDELHRYQVSVDAGGSIVFSSGGGRLAWSGLRCMGATCRCIRCCVIPLTTLYSILSLVTTEGED